MNSNDLLDLIGEVDEQYVQDARAVQPVRRRSVWSLAAAACLLCVLGIGWLLSGTPGWNFGASAPHPYNDFTVLEYTGSDLEDFSCLGQTLVMNEIGADELESFRRFCTVSFRDQPSYYQTSEPLFNILTAYPISGEEDILSFIVHRKDGAFENSLYYDTYLSYLALDENHASFLERLHDLSKDTVDVRYLKEKQILGLSTRPMINCTFTMLIGSDLHGLDPRLDGMLPVFDGTTGNAPSTLNGTEVTVSYFYQTRLYREETTEEAYRYFAYFEINGTQYLCQFSSNWALPGETVSADHNPPGILAPAASQEDCRIKFAEMLIRIISYLQ